MMVNISGNTEPIFLVKYLHGQSFERTMKKSKKNFFFLFIEVFDYYYAQSFKISKDEFI